MSKKHIVSAEWVKDLVFDTKIAAHTIRVAGSIGASGEGPGPKKLLLASLIGCTGMDVVSLMKKMRVPFERFSVEAEAALTEEHPKTYRWIKLTYRLDGGAKEKEAKVRKSVDLSLERYCGVAAMLRKHCPITYEIIYD